jgi:hypothetical protein
MEKEKTAFLVPFDSYDKAQVKAVRLVAERYGGNCSEELADLLSKAKTPNQARALFNDRETGRANQDHLPPKPKIDTDSRL